MTGSRRDEGRLDLTDLQRELVAAPEDGSRVLQVGRSDAVSRALELRGCRVTVIDTGAGQGSPQGEVDAFGRLPTAEGFDAVLFSEGLEESASAEQVLKAAHPMLVDGGVLVASFRNAAHGSVRLALLYGRLPPGEGEQLGGFTAQGASRLFARTGWQILEWRAVDADPIEMLEGWEDVAPTFSRALVEALRVDGDARTFHYVVRAVPRDGDLIGAEPPEADTSAVRVLHEMDLARRRMAALSPRVFFVARMVQRFLTKAFPPRSRRRALTLRVGRMVRRLVRKRPRPQPVGSTHSGSDEHESGPLVEELERDLQEFLSDPDRRLTLPRADVPMVSVLIVTYNKAEHTLRCLSTIAESDGVPLEVILVDNASVDDTHRLLDRLDGVTCIRNSENRHFLHGTNQAAEHASGRYLLLLNNDAYLGRGTLRALVDTADAEKAVGAVGAKLIWPDGRLQEAGSILWRDGSAKGYGRGDDPGRSEYRYRREVDYCSAACLLVRRDLFEDVGGFDRRYEPAYYEDSDLCMSIWARGFRVLYEPRAVVVHNEYTSSDRGRAAELMQANRARFEEKWRDALASRLRPDQVGALLRARDRRPGAPILVIDDRVPSPSYGAGAPRMWALVKFLAEDGYRVTFVPMYFSELPQPATEELEASGVEILEHPRVGVDVADVRRILEARRGFYGKVFVSRPHSAVLVIPIVRELAPEAEIIYDAEALFYRRFELQAARRRTSKDSKRIREMRELEARLIGSADKAVSVAEGEAELMRELTGSDAVFVWGHPTSIAPTGRPFALRSDLLFVGTFGRRWRSPNERGVREFVKRVLPRITDQLGDIRLRIVGRNAMEAVSDLAGPSVRVEGFVEDLEAVYDACRVFINPVTIAAGIPLKLTEAMSRGVPAVTSSVGAQSLGLVDGEHACTARTDAEFGDRVLELYTNEVLWSSIREGALRWVRESCDPDRLRSDLTEVLTAPSRSSPPQKSGIRKKDRYKFAMCRTRLPRTYWGTPL